MSDVLIVVDMINDFVHPEGSMYIGNLDIVKNVKKVVDGFRFDNYNNGRNFIIWVCDNHDENDKEFNRFPKHAVEGTWGAKIHSELYGPQYVSTEFLIKKKRFSGFYNTGLSDALAWIKPRIVEVAGVCTSTSVMDTVGGLANRDYNIFVSRNAIDDIDKEAHKYALNRMKKLYGSTLL